MVIFDLSHLEVVSEVSSILGSASFLNVFAYTTLKNRGTFITFTSNKKLDVVVRNFFTPNVDVTVKPLSAVASASVQGDNAFVSASVSVGS